MASATAVRVSDMHVAIVLVQRGYILNGVANDNIGGNIIKQASINVRHQWRKMAWRNGGVAWRVSSGNGGGKHQASGGSSVAAWRHRLWHGSSSISESVASS